MSDRNNITDSLVADLAALLVDGKVDSQSVKAVIGRLDDDSLWDVMLACARTAPMLFLSGLDRDNTDGLPDMLADRLHRGSINHLLMTATANMTELPHEGVVDMLRRLPVEVLLVQPRRTLGRLLNQNGWIFGIVDLVEYRGNSWLQFTDRGLRYVVLETAQRELLPDYTPQDDDIVVVSPDTPCELRDTPFVDASQARAVVMQPVRRVPRTR